jgi:predicted SprT family Zn-dependent metalloprotease
MNGMQPSEGRSRTGRAAVSQADSLADAGRHRSDQTCRQARNRRARRVDRLLKQLGALWEASALTDVTVVLNPRLSRILGRLVGRPWRIELGPRALTSEKRLLEVVTHEAAHAALATRDGATPQTPHGPEWRELMALAGFPKARGAHWRCRRLGGQSRPERPAKPKAPPALYDHWCPVCQSSRTGRRPVKAWRCAACVAAGLDGTLEITRRARGPKGAR